MSKASRAGPLGQPQKLLPSAIMVLLATLIMMVQPAQANMVLDRSIVHFSSADPARQDVLITNTSSDTLYLQVDVLTVQAPGSNQEDRVQVTDPEHIGLLATPAKMIIPAQGRKLLRLVNLGGINDQERIYRVNVTPVTGAMTLTQETMALQVVIAYQLLVIVQPEQASAQVEASRQGQHLVLRNAGNSNVLLHSGQQCPGSDDNSTDCVALEARRLYAGNTWELDLPFDTPAEFALTAGDQHSRQRF